jgi:hypothetical protein
VDALDRLMATTAGGGMSLAKAAEAAR